MGPRIGSDPPPSPHQQSSSARHVLEISTPEKERERGDRRQTSLEISTSEKEYRRERGGERVIEREGDGERVLQRKRECMFQISTAVRESISDRHKSGDFNVRERALAVIAINVIKAGI
jgi:hypothetical protein